MTTNAIINEKIRQRKEHLFKLRCNLSLSVRETLERQLRGSPENHSAGRHIPRRACDAPLYLSFAQQRLWFIDQMEPGNRFYNLPFATRLRGPLNVAAVGQSFNKIIQRHEALRTTFAIFDGQPRQIIASPQPFRLPIIDLSDLPDREREAAAHKEVQAEAQQVFVLSQGPLFQPRLLKLEAEEHVLMMTMHHIISDGWSMRLLFKELSIFYDCCLRGEDSPLEELPVQYADYAIWQRDYLQGEVLGRQLHYWKGQLSGAPAVIELPTDRPRPAVQGYRGSTQIFSVTEQLSAEVKAFSQREGVSLFMTLLAAFQVLVSRYSGQEDVVLGTPIAGRHLKETEALVGFFVNTLALRVDLSGGPSFREVLTRVKETCLGAYEHQDIPFEKLVEALRPDRSLSHQPLFQIAFQLLQTMAEDRRLMGLSASPFESQVGANHFDLILAVKETPHGLSGSWTYDADLFDSSTIERLGNHFQNLLQGLVDEPQKAVSQLSLLNAAELEQMLDVWNETAGAYPHQCLHQLFEEQAARAPNAVALTFGDEQLSYRELNERANQLAHYLRERGVGGESRVAVCLDRSLEMVVAVLAVLKAGGAYVPLDPAYPQARLNFMLADAEVSVLVTDRAVPLPLPAQVEVICFELSGPPLAGMSKENPRSATLPENLAYVIYTSGSTGQPKGVAVAHRGVVNLITWHQQVYSVRPADRASQVAGQSFDAFGWELWPYLTAGASVHLAPREVVAAPASLVSWLSRMKISFSFLPTPLAAVVLPLCWPERCALRYLLTGGDRLHSPKGGPWPFALVNHYGPTEYSVVTTSAAVAQTELVPAIGRPIANTKVYLLDAFLQAVPVGVFGELYISGAGLARGYWNQPALTAERFLPSPFSTASGERLYKTGDLARYLPGGQIEFGGRVDRQVKLRGFRIELGEIEAVLHRQAMVRGAAVALVESEAEKEIVAYVVLKDAAEDEGIRQIRDYLREELPDHMAPSRYVVLPELPLTAHGKIDRDRLPAPDQQRSEAEAGVYVEPRTLVEKVLAAIWTEILGCENVGSGQNFFDLGGHSLSAAMVTTRIREVFHLELPLQVFFQCGTIANLGENIVTSAALASLDAEAAARVFMRVNSLSEPQVQAMLHELEASAQGVAP
jgi:amino acid adenylation domain-containing protein